MQDNYRKAYSVTGEVMFMLIPLGLLYLVELLYFKNFMLSFLVTFILISLTIMLQFYRYKYHTIPKPEWSINWTCKALTYCSIICLTLLVYAYRQEFSLILITTGFAAYINSKVGQAVYNRKLKDDSNEKEKHSLRTQIILKDSAITLLQIKPSKSLTEMSESELSEFCRRKRLSADEEKFIILHFHRPDLTDNEIYKMIGYSIDGGKTLKKRLRKKNII